jgi:hypothetical protein
MQDVYIEPLYHRNKNPFKSANFSISYYIVLLANASNGSEFSQKRLKQLRFWKYKPTEYLFIEWKHHSIVIGAGPTTRWFTNRHNSFSNLFGLLPESCWIFLSGRSRGFNYELNIILIIKVPWPWPAPLVDHLADVGREGQQVVVDIVG